MNTNVLRLSAVLGLPAAILLRPVLGDGAALLFVIGLGALALMVRAGLAGMYTTAAALTMVAVLFNPLVPVALFSLQLLWMYATCLLAFSVCLVLLKFHLRPRLSMPSITGRTPGSQSL